MRLTASDEKSEKVAFSMVDSESVSPGKLVGSRGRSSQHRWWLDEVDDDDDDIDPDKIGDSCGWMDSAAPRDELVHFAEECGSLCPEALLKRRFSPSLRSESFSSSLAVSALANSDRSLLLLSPAEDAVVSDVRGIRASPLAFPDSGAWNATVS